MSLLQHQVCRIFAHNAGAAPDLLGRGQVEGFRIRRYGFHGLSYEYIATKLPVLS